MQVPGWTVGLPRDDMTRKPIDMTHESPEVVRASYLRWVRYRCPHVNRRGDQCILTIWDAAGAHHDYGYESKAS